MPDVVEVGRFDNLFAAMRAQGLLANEEIESEVLDQNMGTLLPLVGAIGVRLVVRAEDVERARAVLDAASAHGRPEGATGDEGADDDSDVPDAAGTADGQPSRPVDVDAWARRTRALAICGIAVFILAIGAVFRVSAPPEGIERSPQAMRMLRQARWAAWTGIGITLLSLSLLRWL